MHDPKQRVWRADEQGAWVTWELALALPKLAIRPPSRWKVFLAILFVWCRYGRNEAYLTIQQIAEGTCLSKRTVTAALKDLIAQGLVRRIGRCGKLAVNPAAIAAGAIGDEELRQRGNNNNSPHIRPEAGRTRDQLAQRTGPTLSDAEAGPSFTSKQVLVIERCFREATELLGFDCRNLTLSNATAMTLELRPTTTFGEAYDELHRQGQPRACRDFVAAVLGLRSDERVCGRDIAPQPCVTLCSNTVAAR